MTTIYDGEFGMMIKTNYDLDDLFARSRWSIRNIVLNGLDPWDEFGVTNRLMFV